MFWTCVFLFTLHLNGLVPGEPIEYEIQHAEIEIKPDEDPKKPDYGNSWKKFSNLIYQIEQGFMNILKSGNPLGIPVTSLYQKESNIEGIIKMKCDYNVSEIIPRLKKALKTKGFTITKTVPHCCQSGPVILRPTISVLFENHKLDSKLIEANPEIGLDIPWAVLAYTDQDGQTWLTYRDPSHVAALYGIKERPHMVGAMKVLTTQAVNSALFDNFDNDIDTDTSDNNESEEDLHVHTHDKF